MRSRSCQPLRIGTRPRGLFGRSRLAKRLALKPCSSSYTPYEVIPPLGRPRRPGVLSAARRSPGTGGAGSETWRSFGRSVTCSRPVSDHRRTVAFRVMALLLPAPSRASVLGYSQAINLDGH